MTNHSPLDTPPPARQPIISAPPVLIWILGAMWTVYALLVLAPASLLMRVDHLIALSPILFLQGPGAEGGYFTWLAPLVGHMFVHASLMHIGVNSLWFLAFGAPVVRRLTRFGQEGPAILGAFRGPPADGFASLLFFIFFITCGIGGALFFILLNMREPALLVGASGGVSGLLGGLILFLNRPRTNFVRGYRPLSAMTDPIVVTWVIVMIGLNISSGVFGLGVGDDGPNIAWEAHIGGFLTGLLTFPAFDRIAQLRSGDKANPRR